MSRTVVVKDIEYAVVRGGAVIDVADSFWNASVLASDRLIPGEGYLDVHELLTVQDYFQKDFRILGALVAHIVKEEA